MENQQSLQPSSQLSDSQPAPVRRRVQAESTGANVLLRLVAQQPWLVWSGVSVFLLAMVATAITSLMHAEGAEQEELDFNVAAERVAATSSPSRPMTLWLLGGVALSCGAGSLLMLKWLNRPSSPPQLRTLHRQASVQTAPQQAMSLPSRRSRRRRHERGQSVPHPARSSQIASMPVSREPVVTVLPPEKIRPERSEADLAEMMDLRKQQPLSAILRDL